MRAVVNKYSLDNEQKISVSCLSFLKSRLWESTLPGGANGTEANLKRKWGFGTVVCGDSLRHLEQYSANSGWEIRIKDIFTILPSCRISLIISMGLWTWHTHTHQQPHRFLSADWSVYCNLQQAITSPITHQSYSDSPLTRYYSNGF